ncbi:hypothetical protein [Saccharothrix luteola]|uniref:hypothetical protein n=1 Tax=Saccharothrix luteola TaxID=2893018 RepID=UPI001E5E8D38|nr:hypothetical protein [Saccharothrix luteola]MCC8245967.1 hypothetical protein [Saccharothrix luteola]
MSGNCLVARSAGWIDLGDCTGVESRRDARGKNGWVMLWNRAFGGCLVPWGTDVPGDYYPLVLEWRDPGNLDNVPNIRARRYFGQNEALIPASNAGGVRSPPPSDPDVESGRRRAPATVDPTAPPGSNTYSPRGNRANDAYVRLPATAARRSRAVASM